MFYSATIHLAELRDANCRRFVTSSFPSSLMLDGVTSFLCMETWKTKDIHEGLRLRYSQTFGGISSLQWQKVVRIGRIQLFFHHFFCVRIEIDQL